ncbi:hypothetical protein FH972_001184 [Carpinus fangiana]|uniref:Uncharacterized protein n=1 Tax=Carpinus fangiana TaxID=176857 RepID=A0A5N6QDD8_9ROSI|nr:hypothetical protein FH972_001184 [Carpinus fangiana]
MVVGGRRQSRRSVVVVWGVSSAKCGHLQSIAVRGLGRRRRWLGVSPDCRGWASPVRSVAAMVEGGGGSIMRRYSPPYCSPPRRGYGGRGRSPPRRGYGGGGYGRRNEQNHGSLLVRNIPLNCR